MRTAKLEQDPYMAIHDNFWPWTRFMLTAIIQRYIYIYIYIMLSITITLLMTIAVFMTIISPVMISITMVILLTNNDDYDTSYNDG